MRLRWNVVATLLLLGLVLVTLWQLRWDVSGLEQWIAAHRLLGIATYLLAVIASVVLLPLSSLPLLPAAARIFGVWQTAVLSIAGWWIGCLIAFQIARCGRPYLEKFTPLAPVDRLEQRIPKDISFVGIVILRMILPVDITSFALGLLKHLSFSTYAVASLIGITPFAFVWSYAGGALEKGAVVSASLIVTGMMIGTLIIRRLLHTRRAAKPLMPPKAT